MYNETNDQVNEISFIVGCVPTDFIISLISPQTNTFVNFVKLETKAKIDDMIFSDIL
jgi:hypothetical protein